MKHEACREIEKLKSEIAALTENIETVNDTVIRLNEEKLELHAAVGNAIAASEKVFIPLENRKHYLHDIFPFDFEFISLY